MGWIENIWWMLVLLGVMILFHELGHYWAARLFDVKVEAFSFGFGPRLFGFRRGETDFRFSLFLLGGYVKMAGEQPGEEGADDPRSLLAKPRWQRLVIVGAGPFMNFVLAIALVTGLYTVSFPKLIQTPNPVIGYVDPEGAAAAAGVHEGDRVLLFGNTRNPTWEDVTLREIGSANQAVPVLVERIDGTQDHVTITPTLDEKNAIGVAGWAEASSMKIDSLLPGMPAERAGLKKGDQIAKANGVKVQSVRKLQDIFKASGGKAVELSYLRDGQEKTISVQPEWKDLDGEKRWVIGVNFESPVKYVSLPVPEALRESLRANARMSGLIFGFLKGIIERRMSATSIEGPIRIAQISTEAAREGPSSFIWLMAMVSLNLAIFNLLPIPILDGGQILLLAIEMVIRRDLSLAVKETVFKLGFVFLMMVVVFVLVNDIRKILPG